MNPMYVFIACYLGTIFFATAAFLTFKFRYAWRSGYFKASFRDSAGRTSERIFRPKLTVNVRGDREFVLKHYGKAHTYGYPSLLDHTIKWRLPHASYHVGVYSPFSYKIVTTKKGDVATAETDGSVASDRYNEVARNTVTSQLLNAFMPPALNAATAFFLGILITMGGFLILGWFMNEKFTEVLEAVR